MQMIELYQSIKNESVDDDKECSQFFLEMTERLQKEQYIWHEFENQFTERLIRLKWMQEAHKELFDIEFKFSDQKVRKSIQELLETRCVYYTGKCLKSQVETELFRILGTKE